MPGAGAQTLLEGNLFKHTLILEAAEPFIEMITKVHLTSIPLVRSKVTKSRSSKQEIEAQILSIHAPSQLFSFKLPTQ
jgi:hypothetical protein